LSGGERATGEDEAMKVWVDQDLCTGDGLCVDVCPSMFVLEGGISYVRSPGGASRLVAGASGAAHVPDGLVDGVLDAAEECPGECIFVE
jgi:ferredoxin